MSRGKIFCFSNLALTERKVQIRFDLMVVLKVWVMETFVIGISCHEMITFLSKWHDIFSCLFQYSEIAISSTETNDTSYESPGLQLLDSGRSIASNIMGMPLPLAVISIFCQIAIFSNFGPMVQSSRPLWKVTWNFLWIFDFGPMVQRSSPLQDVSWNNL